jgi:hypothetical protein
MTIMKQKIGGDANLCEDLFIGAIHYCQLIRPSITPINKL